MRQISNAEKAVLTDSFGLSVEMKVDSPGYFVSIEYVTKFAPASF